ncbi:MAG: hypothetical protein WAL25_06065 [Acidimicrobiia bacterium]
MVTPGGAGSGPDSPRPVRGRALSALVVGLGALVVLILASRPDAVPATTTLPIVVGDPTSTTTSLPSSTPTTPGGPHLVDLLPEVDGDLVTAVTGETGLRLLSWPSGSEQTARDIPMNSGPFLDFDVSGLRLAFLGESATEGEALYTGRIGRWQPLATGATAFRWHSTRPAALAWTELGRGVCRADLDDEASVASDLTCLHDAPGVLVGYDDLGFLLVDGHEVVRLDLSGTEIGRVAGTGAEVGPDASVLIFDRLADGSIRFSMSPPDLSTSDPLGWAPEHATGEYGLVAWSPHDPGQLAFLTMSESGWYGIDRWTVDGYRLNSIQVGARLWDISWDDTGRYLLAPGESDTGNSLVYVFDTFANRQAFVPFAGRVQDAQLVVESVCEEAGFLRDDWPPGRLPEGVGATNYQMVLSRNAELESWYFLSARLQGGDHDGEIATWALPGYNGEGEYVLSPVPVNTAAVGRSGPSSLEPVVYGVTDWMDLDGAAISQWCVESADG